MPFPRVQSYLPSIKIASVLQRSFSARQETRGHENGCGNANGNHMRLPFFMPLLWCFTFMLVGRWLPSLTCAQFLCSLVSLWHRGARAWPRRNSDEASSDPLSPCASATFKYSKFAGEVFFEWTPLTPKRGYPQPTFLFCILRSAWVVYSIGHRCGAIFNIKNQVDI